MGLSNTKALREQKEAILNTGPSMNLAPAGSKSDEGIGGQKLMLPEGTER